MTRRDSIAALFDALRTHREGPRNERPSLHPRAERRAFLQGLSARHRASQPAVTGGEPDPFAVAGVDRDPEALARVLAWWMDPAAEHGLGARPARRVAELAGVPPSVVTERYTVKPEGELVWLRSRARRAAVCVGDRPEALPEGVAAEAVYSVRGEALARELELMRAEVSPATGWMLTAWARALRRGGRGNAMTDWKGFSPDVEFLLDHWREFLDVVAVKEGLDREFVALREHLAAAVRARWPESDGWDCTLDEDWILLRRRSWPIPAEEWLAFVVVLTDVDALFTEGREGWWSALSLPTDGDFDGESFTNLLRARVDANAWRPWLAQSWPDHALGRALPRLSPGPRVGEALESAVLDEFQRFVELAPAVEQCLRDLR